MGLKDFYCSSLPDIRLSLWTWFWSNAGQLIDDSLAYVDVICFVCWV